MKVKNRAAELVHQLSEEYKSDRSLGIMTETYNTLRSQGISTEPPSKPLKRDITEDDKMREEEELQMALAMSLNEAKISQGSNSKQDARKTQEKQRLDRDDPYTLPVVDQSSPIATQSQPLQQTPISERTAATVSRVRALYEFTASETGELTFHKGDVITVIESAYKDWWRGSLHGNIGIFPTNYVENLAEPTPAELQREAEDEARVFSEAKNVEKLLSILSSADARDSSIADNEQLQNLYHSTLAIRPKLVKLIEKYSQKKGLNRCSLSID